MPWVMHLYIPTPFFLILCNGRHIRSDVLSSAGDSGGGCFSSPASSAPRSLAFKHDEQGRRSAHAHHCEHPKAHITIVSSRMKLYI